MEVKSKLKRRDAKIEKLTDEIEKLQIKNKKMKKNAKKERINNENYIKMDDVKEIDSSLDSK